MLPSCVAPGQVHKSGDRLGNWSGDGMREIAIRWKNGVWMLQLSPTTIKGSCLLQTPIRP